MKLQFTVQNNQCSFSSVKKRQKTKLSCFILYYCNWKVSKLSFKLTYYFCTANRKTVHFSFFIKTPLFQWIEKKAYTSFQVFPAKVYYSYTHKLLVQLLNFWCHTPFSISSKIQANTYYSETIYNRL